jgi:hydroxymethylbilane synthase
VPSRFGLAGGLIPLAAGPAVRGTWAAPSPHSQPNLSLPDRIAVATRESPLALWQARHVADRMRALYPQLRIELLGMTTEGDRRLDGSLAQIGGKGLFVKELEQALDSGRADIAVHSMKDVPMQIPADMVIAAITARDDPRDALVSPRFASLPQMPAGSRIGTSSLRRESQLRARYPQLEVAPLRGNVHTRIRRLDEGRFDGVILAAAGLKRLGLQSRIASLLEPEDSLPAVGQGAIGVECRIDRRDLVGLLAALDDPPTRWCVEAERALSRALAGSCNVPLGGYASWEGRRVRLRAFVAAPDGSRLVREESYATDGETPEELGRRVADVLTARGAGDILAALRAGQR